MKIWGKIFEVKLGEMWILLQYIKMNKMNGHMSGLGTILYQKLYVCFNSLVFIHFSNTDLYTHILKTIFEGNWYKKQQIFVYVKVRKINDHINIKIIITEDF